MKLKKIAECLGCRLTAGADLEISGVAGLEQAKSGELTFLSNPRYTRLVETTKASAIIIEKEIDRRGLACLLSDNPYLDFARALELFYESPRPATGIHPTAVVAESAKIGRNASIGPYAIIGQSVVLGRGAVIHPHVAIYEGAEIGRRFPGSFSRRGAGVLSRRQPGHPAKRRHRGGDGYGFVRKPDGSHYKIVQAGRVVIEDDVESRLILVLTGRRSAKPESNAAPSSTISYRSAIPSRSEKTPLSAPRSALPVARPSGEIAFLPARSGWSAT